MIIIKYLVKCSYNIHNDYSIIYIILCTFVSKLGGRMDTFQYRHD